MEKMSYVSLIDRSPVRRIGISHLLGRQGLHIEPFEDVSEFLKFRPTIGLVLVHDEDKLLVPLVREMAREQCWYPHVVYSEEPQWQRAVDAVTNGARTYVAFPDQIEEIQRIHAAVHKVVLATSDSANRKAMAKARIDVLTPREIDVLEGVIAGYTNRLIAEHLRISARTVEVHRANLLKKMDAKNGADLVRIAVDADFSACQPGRALSEQRGTSRRALLASTDAAQISSLTAKPLSPVQFLAGGDPLGGDDVRPLPVELAERGRPAGRARHRHLP